MEGMRHGVLLPVVSSLCFSPMAACSCFSTAVILASSTVMVFGEVVLAAGYVEESFNCCTMSSTSDNLASNLAIRSSMASTTFSTYSILLVWTLFRSF